MKKAQADCGDGCAQAMSDSSHQSQRSVPVIKIRPYRGGWQCFEGDGVQPYFVEGDAKRSAVEYATARMTSRPGRFGFTGQTESSRKRCSLIRNALREAVGLVWRSFRFFESCRVCRAAEGQTISSVSTVVFWNQINGRRAIHELVTDLVRQERSAKTAPPLWVSPIHDSARKPSADYFPFQG